MSSEEIGLAVYAYQLGYAQTILRELMPNGIGVRNGHAFTHLAFDGQYRNGEDQAFCDLLAKVALRGFDFPNGEPPAAIKNAVAQKLELHILTGEEWTLNRAGEKVNARLAEMGRRLGFNR